MRSFFISFLLVVTWTGCKKDPLENYRSQVASKIDAIKQLAAKPLPILSSDTLAYSGPLERLSQFSKEGTVALFPQEKLRSIGTTDPSLPFYFDPDLDNVASWVVNPAASSYSLYRDRNAEALLQMFVRLDKVFVIKTTEIRYPIRNDKVFRPGWYRGEAHLFDISGKYYGGVRFSATSSDKVSFQYNKDEKGVIKLGDSEKSLNNDLLLQARKAFEAAAKRVVPQARF